MLAYFVVISCALLADAKLTPRIYYGNNARVENYPYQVSLDSNGSHVCGGSILSEYFVLTAAHCQNLVNHMDTLYVRAANSFPGKGGTLHKVTKFQYNNTYQPIKLFKPNEEAIPGSKAVVTGFGLMENNRPAKQLQAVELSIISKQACVKAHQILPESQICALGGNGKGACIGDSGGPIAIDGRLAGIVSWGRGACDTKYPSVYTEVSHYHDWINKHVQF